MDKKNTYRMKIIGYCAAALAFVATTAVSVRALTSRTEIGDVVGRSDKNGQLVLITANMGSVPVDKDVYDRIKMAGYQLHISGIFKPVVHKVTPITEEREFPNNVLVGGR